ncbi:8109_t:CDS:2 [Gigaspora rosea]|nr:8109_t:CDS:2 [Gigaspora rosea]
MAKTSSTPRAKKAANPPAHPKYEDMIRDKNILIYAIVALKDRKGSSSYKLPDNTTTNNRLRIAINKGVEKGLFAFYNGPSGTIKLVKKEPEPKPKVEKKPKKAAPKKTAKKATTKKTKKPTTKTTKRAKPGARKTGARKSTTRKRTTS